jgi:hypothetical protein
MGGFFFLLAAWFVFSVLNQWGSSGLAGLRRFDSLHLLPIWNFFAPSPGVNDYYLLYRDKSEVGELGTWHLVQPTRSRRWDACLWNPDKVRSKVLSDLVQVLAKYQKLGMEESSAVMLSVPYLVCLKMVIDEPPRSPGCLRQFVLARKKGLVTSDKLLPILVSEFHAI